LFKYIDENLYDGESIELYTCWDGDELKEKDDTLNIVVNLKTKYFKNDIGNFKINEKRLFDELSERFSFRERQYVVVTK
jgi:phage tail tube protein FII